jgi:regulator of replication initiation timing
VLRSDMNMEDLVKEFNSILAERDAALTELVERNTLLANENADLRATLSRFVADKTVVFEPEFEIDLIKPN